MRRAARLALAAAGLAAATAACGGREPAPMVPAPGAAAPIVAMYEWNINRTTAHWDEPRFVLYADGWVIYRRDVPDAPDSSPFYTFSSHFYAFSISPQAAEHFRQRLLGLGIRSVSAENMVAPYTHADESYISVATPQGWHVAGVYGPEAISSTCARLAPFVAAQRAIDELVDGRGEPWQPETLEVKLSHDPEMSKLENPAWPDHLPRPTEKLGGVERHSFEISGEHDAAIQRFLGPGLAEFVALDGRTWLMSYRRKVPYHDDLERAWRRARAGRSVSVPDDCRCDFLNPESGAPPCADRGEPSPPDAVDPAA